MKKTRLISVLATVVCCIGGISVPGTAVTGVAVSVKNDGIMLISDDIITSDYTVHSVRNYADAVNNFMKQNNIAGTVYPHQMSGEDKVIVLCEKYEDETKVKVFIFERGFDENTFYYDFYTDDNEVTAQNIIDYTESITSFMRENNIFGKVDNRLMDGVEKVVVLCEKSEDQSKIKAFVIDNGIDENILYFDYYTYTMGDIDDNGYFTVSDVVLLQKWLLALPDTNLTNWKAADFCDDGKVDVFDLCLMKRALINSTEI